MSFEDYKAFVAEYTLEKTAEMTGVPKDQLEQLAQLYADPNKKVISYWTMGFNQHTRGVWANNLVYNLHLLTGKISQPGCGPFSLTGSLPRVVLRVKWAPLLTVCLRTWW